MPSMPAIPARLLRFQLSWFRRLRRVPAQRIPSALQWRGLLLAITERALMTRRGRAYSNLSFRPRNAAQVWAWPFPEGSFFSTADPLLSRANQGKAHSLG